ncbi:MAG: 3-deoxy-7-phosphoheptulonate synthase [Clostridia bacterium]|nr:3-deoxy-7-phosphoheptulonate synthase [Clostridia bacterium]
MNLKFYRKLPIPLEIKEQYPVTEKMAKEKKKRDKEIHDVFFGESNKFILIIGPCSADKMESVLEYVGRLKKISEEVSDKLIIIPRIYTNKPRTTGDGYKGMLHQPDPKGHPDMLKGIVATRELHMAVLRDYGMSGADEMLYPDNHRYLSDLLSYAAVGARSVENQQHRLTASGLDIPVGLKNPTEGDLNVMMNAIIAAQHPHTFIYRGWEVESTGNLLAHAIMRGYQTVDGRTIPNYHYEDLLSVYELYKKFGLQNPSVVVDTNHANSGKKYLEQPRIASDVIHSMRQNNSIRKLCKGLMIESYLVDGAQKVDGGTFGQSITDPCIGWDKTAKLIYDIADKL